MGRIGHPGKAKEDYQKSVWLMKENNQRAIPVVGLRKCGTYWLLFGRKRGSDHHHLACCCCGGFLSRVYKPSLQNYPSSVGNKPGLSPRALFIASIENTALGSRLYSERSTDSSSDDRDRARKRNRLVYACDSL